MSLSIDHSSEKRFLDRPIILIGSPRSGTSLLGRLLAAHPDVAHWKEPRMVWSTGNQHLPDDVLLEEHLTPEIAAEIDQRFGDFLKRSGKSRFSEKTPSNMLRLPFIRALYPDCKIIHICRDPRPVVASALVKLSATPELKRIIARASEAQLSDWPGLIKLFFRDAIGRLFRGGDKSFWGPRPPGWREWQNLSPATKLSKQWCALIKTAQHDLQQLPADSWMEFRYEDLLTDHAQILPKLLEFAELSPSSEVTALANQSINPDRAETWQQNLSPEQLSEIEAECANMLTKLGYDL